MSESMDQDHYRRVFLENEIQRQDYADARRNHEEPYLISKYSHSTARIVAGANGLKPHEWIFIPMDEQWRDRALRGRRVSRDKLLGYFTDEEIQQLTGRP